MLFWRDPGGRVRMSEVALVNPLVPQLLEWTGSLIVPQGVSPEALRTLRALIAASILQDNPAHAQIDLTDLDPWIVEAIQAGLARAEALRAAGIRLRIVPEDVPLGPAFEVPAERPSEVLGPFVSKSGGLVRFVAYESSKFLVVHVQGGAAWLYVPFESQPSADDFVWTLPAGTVWIEAGYLVADVPGFTGLRISSGELRFDQATTRVQDRILAVPAATWSLTLVPEQPGAGDLTLPTKIEIREGAGAQITGNLSFDALSFAPLAAAPRVDDRQICFSLDPAGQTWSPGNQSPVMRIAGECAVGEASYALPIVNPVDHALSEALHGGSLVARVKDGLTGVIAGQTGGPFRWFDSKLRANARYVELDAPQADSAARYEADLWPSVNSAVVFAQVPIVRLLLRRERGGPDAVAVLGGKVRNRWDLPRRADGEPFGFEGAVEVFGLLHDAAGFRVVCSALSEPQQEAAAIALENVYLRVRPPRRCVFVSHVVSRSGIATLFFDASWAIPTLPDPYAWNLRHTDSGGGVENALRIRLMWENAQAPVMSAHLDEMVAFPEYAAEDPRDEDEGRLQALFRRHLHSEHESFRLLDLSSREHLFGVGLDQSLGQRATIVENRLNVELRQVRLLMQPQVQWEPVQDAAGVLRSRLNGGPTLAGAHAVKLVPVLPGVVAEEITEAAHANLQAAALFSLPFGLRAMVRLSPRDGGHPMTTELHEPTLGSLKSARQIRLRATGDEPSRQMPGAARQLGNLFGPGSTSVLDIALAPNAFRDRFNDDFGNSVPLHHADLSGYGLSTFSNWSKILDTNETGFTKAYFHVLNGRTTYEVIQFQSYCWPCEAIFVRTLILERRNSGTVVRFDLWDAVTPGLYEKPHAFEKGVVRGLHNIRRIRVAGPEADLDGTAKVLPVLFDADAEFEDVIAGGVGGRVPVYDQVGYVQMHPELAFNEGQLRMLFQKYGAIGGPVDCRIRANKTLEMHLSSILADYAPNDANQHGFAIAGFGSPKLPRAGQWSSVRIEPSTFDAAPVDPRRGVPVSRLGAGAYQFREAADVRRTDPRTMYGFLMTTQTSRALFPQPRLEPAQVGKLLADRPVIADPYSLCQASGAMPRPSFGLRAQQTPVFDIGAGDAWRIQNPDFTFDKPLPELVKGGEWSIGRAYDNLPLRLNIDSGIPIPWDVAVPPSNLEIDIPPFGKIMTIRTKYVAESAAVPKLDEPDLLFSGALEELKKTLDSLQHLVKLPFHVTVTVTAAGAASASFIVRIDLKFRIGEGPNERIDIGLGKFYGEFLIRGELEAGLTGVKRGLLLAQFTGDLQQGILPPLLYAGGLFRFAVEIRDTGKPLVQLTFAAVASLGGDLVKNLIEVEVTVKYGYSLIPETLQPGVFLGLEVRAKLLGGLFGFSFGAEVMARIARADTKTVTIAAQIRVVATVQIAYFIEDDVDFETEFEQKIPLAAVAVIGGVNPLAAAALL